MNSPDRVILHCAATSDTDKLHQDFDVEDIDRWHKERGWDGVGYHFVIKRDGSIQEGRELSKYGAHTKGYNKDSIGICYVGSHLPTVEQIESIIILHRRFRDQMNIQWSDWYGHYEFAEKECPGFDMETMRNILRKIS